MYEIQSLGGVVVRDADRSPLRFRSKKHVALLIYLATGDGRVHSRRYLASLLWESSAERARHSLSQAIYDLRSNLEGALLKGPGEHVRLDFSRIRFDAADFEAAVKRGDLAAAVELHRGPFAENLSDVGSREFQHWLESERHRLSRMGQLALRRHVQECDRAGRWGEMCVAALKLVRLSSLDEEAHRALMRGLWMHGDGTSAVRHFEEVAPMLERELPDGISDETVALVRRIRTVPTPHREPQRFVDPDPPFLGREEEYDFLRTAVAEMGQGRRTALIVYGEGGIGKTRLLHEFKPSLILDGIRVLESRCYPAESEVPYGPVIEGLRPIAGELARAEGVDSEGYTRIGYLLPEFEHLCRPHDEGVEPAAWRRRLYEEVASLLRLACSRERIVWIVEDAQWIDATSASLLHYLTRRLDGADFLLIITRRVRRGEDLPDSLPAHTPGPDGFTRALRLAPLSEEHIRSIVLHVRPVSDEHLAIRLAQHLSGGNPFLALELFRAALESGEWAEDAHLWDALTDRRLRRVLAVRFQGLSTPALNLLSAIAVLERNATPAALAAVAGHSLSDTAEFGSELYLRGLIRDTAGVVEFANDIIREYVYADMTALERAALHLNAATFLSDEPTATAATLARHFHLGGDRIRTHEYAVRAAREAEDSGGQQEAAVMAGLALETASNLKERLVALALLGEAELGSGQLGAAKEHFEQLLRLDEDMSLERQVEVKLQIVRALGGQASWCQAEEVLAEVILLLQKLGNRPRRQELRFETLNWRLKAASRNNDFRRARDVAGRIDRLRRAAESVDALTPIARITADCSLAAYEMFFESAEAAADRLATCNPDDPVLPDALRQRILLLRGLANLRLARWTQADHDSRRALVLARKANDALDLSSVLTNLACSAIERGAWDEAEQLSASTLGLQEALCVALDASLPIRMNAANLAFYRGRIPLALNTYSQALDVARTRGLSEFRAELEACVGLCGLYLGDTNFVRESWRAVEGWDEDALRAVQERFKIEWFRAYMRRTEEPDAVFAALERAADQQERIDRVNYLKLCWLKHLLVPTKSTPMARADVRSMLAESGLGWFARFTERWLRVASSKNVL